MALFLFRLGGYREFWAGPGFGAGSLFWWNIGIALCLGVLSLVELAGAVRQPRRWSDVAVAAGVFCFVVGFACRFVFLGTHYLDDRWYAEAMLSEPIDQGRMYLGLVVEDRALGSRVQLDNCRTHYCPAPAWSPNVSSDPRRGTTRSLYRSTAAAHGHLVCRLRRPVRFPIRPRKPLPFRTMPVERSVRADLFFALGTARGLLVERSSTIRPRIPHAEVSLLRPWDPLLCARACPGSGGCGGHRAIPCNDSRTIASLLKIRNGEKTNRLGTPAEHI